MEAKGAAGMNLSKDTIELHLMIADAAHNGVLSEMMKVIIPELVAHGHKIANEIPDRAEIEISRHRELWTKIRSGDPEVARAAMASHIQDSASLYLLPYDSKGMKESPEAFLP
jgi:DNA-binding FadR family transcriptional regulator